MLTQLHRPATKKDVDCLSIGGEGKTNRTPRWRCHSCIVKNTGSSCQICRYRIIERFMMCRSSCFAGSVFAFAEGRFSHPKDDIEALILNHGGVVMSSVVDDVTHLIGHGKDLDVECSPNKWVQEAIANSVPIVTFEYILDCIVEGRLIDSKVMANGATVINDETSTSVAACSEVRGGIQEDGSNDSGPFNKTDTWACTHCTFENKGGRTSCEMCGNLRPDLTESLSGYCLGGGRRSKQDIDDETGSEKKFRYSLPEFEYREFVVRCLAIIRDVCDNKIADAFLEEVDTSIYYDYKEFVKKPMDFFTITGRLKRGHYKSDLSTFMDDIRQIWKNCELYNGKSAEITKNALKLEAIAERGWTKYIRDDDRPPFESLADNKCSVCREGGDALTAQCTHCLSLYHPQCVSEDESDSESTWSYSCPDCVHALEDSEGGTPRLLQLDEKPFKGKVFAISGKISWTNDEVKELISTNGGELQDSDFDYLITSDDDNMTSKDRGAFESRIPLVKEEFVVEGILQGRPPIFPMQKPKNNNGKEYLAISKIMKLRYQYECKVVRMRRQIGIGQEVVTEERLIVSQKNFKISLNQKDIFSFVRITSVKSTSSQNPCMLEVGDMIISVNGTSALTPKDVCDETNLARQSGKVCSFRIIREIHVYKRAKEIEDCINAIKSFKSGILRIPVSFQFEEDGTKRWDVPEDLKALQDGLAKAQKRLKSLKQQAEDSKTPQETVDRILVLPQEVYRLGFSLSTKLSNDNHVTKKIWISNISEKALELPAMKDKCNIGDQIISINSINVKSLEEAETQMSGDVSLKIRQKVKTPEQTEQQSTVEEQKPSSSSNNRNDADGIKEST